MPALEALLNRLAKAHTQPLGMSVDSLHCHANWGVSLGGISFPLLADFHPKGKVGTAYGIYLDEAGLNDRATVVIDAGGIVRHASSVTPAGERNIEELVRLCEQVDANHGNSLPSPDPAPGMTQENCLYVKSRCGFSQRVLAARSNLHLSAVVPVRNVSEDANAMEELEKLTGKRMAPCLVVNGEPLLESDDIVRALVTRVDGWWD